METQLALRERTSSAVMALAASALVFACLPEESAVVVSALRKGGIWLAALFCAVSLGFWWRFFRKCVKLRALGLYKRPRGLLIRWSWELAGSFAGVAVIGTICAAFGWRLQSWGAGALPGLLAAVWLGRRLNQIPDYDSIRAQQARVLSLRQGEDE